MRESIYFSPTTYFSAIIRITLFLDYVVLDPKRICWQQCVSFSTSSLRVKGFFSTTDDNIHIQTPLDNKKKK